jgi:tRNA A37 threonylcarbamoyladenosine modification protein TsaB
MSKNLLLLLNTAGPTTIIALADTAGVLGSEQFVSSRFTSVELLQALDRLLVKNRRTLTEVQRIAVHPGPGHYSGLRAGFITALMLAEAHDAEIVYIQSENAADMWKEALVAKPVAVPQPTYT